MAFSTTPIAKPGASADGQSSAANDARARAVAKLMGGASEALPVANANAISPEEAGALKAPSAKAPEPGSELSAEESPGAEGQKQKDETPSEESPSEAKKDEALSPQFAMLARKEKALRAKVDAFKQQEATLLAREEALKAKEAEYGEGFVSKEQLLADPIAVLASLGMDYDQITQQVMSRPQVDPGVKALIDDLKSEIKSLKGEQEKSLNSQKEQQTQAYKQAVAQIRAEAAQLVKADPSFETIKETDSIGDVVELIEATFKEDGYLMTVEEAAKAVEEHLVEEAMRLAKLSKIQQRLKPAAKAAEPAPAQDAGNKQPQQAKTLTNAMGTQRKMSARERAIAAFEANKTRNS